MLLFAGMSGNAVRCLADEAFTPPSEDERKAVAALVEKGATLNIDGRYQVIRVSISTTSQITDEDLRHLGAFKSLKSLTLSGSRLTDAAIEHLKPLKKLETLTLASSVFTAKVRDELKQALPDCRINSGPFGGSGGFAGGSTSPDSRSTARGGPGDRDRGSSSFPRSLSTDLSSPAVEQDLKLTPEQKHEIAKLSSREFIDTQINTVLTAEQRARLPQIRLQQEGPTAFQSNDLANELKLTEEQRAAIRRVMEDRTASARKLFEQARNLTNNNNNLTEEVRRMTTEVNEKILALLTNEQRQAWNTKIGPPFAGKEGSGGFFGGLTSPDPRSTTRGGPGDRDRGPSSFSRPLSTELRSLAVEQDLKLTPEQKQEIAKLSSRDFIDTQIYTILTAEQRARLPQIRLQQEGPTAFQRDELANELKLTEEQRATVRRVLEDRTESSRKLLEQTRDPASGRLLDVAKYTEESRRITSEANAKILAALTNEQRQAWNAKVGPSLPNVATPPSTRTSTTNRPTETTEERARQSFSLLDRDNDGKLTAEEWARSRNLRPAFDRAKITIEFPVNLETFVKQYLQAYPPRPAGNQ
jgi:Spy/CpxP family protein refolding chaperone